MSASITDRTLALPLPTAALLDAAEADNAVAEALIAKGNPVLQKWGAAAENAGQAGSILKVLATRGITVSEAQRQEILVCNDPDRLEHRQLLIATNKWRPA